jgi:tetratricopeptide (TPR) repeat protein
MTKRFLFALLASIALNACAAQPNKPLSKLASDRVASAEEAAPPTAVEKSEVESPPLPAQELTAKIVYQLLLAEIAVQRGRTNVALATYLDVAKSTKDPRVAQRATELAMYARQPREAYEAVKLWAETDPNSVQARQILVSLMIGDGQIEQARPYMQKMLTGDEQQIRQSFFSLNSLLAKQPDKPAALKLVKELAEPFPKMAEAHYAVAVAAFNAKDNDLALTEAKQAAELKPGWEPGALLQGQLLWQSNKDDALKFLKGFLGTYAESNEVRLAYARYLAERKDYNGAREQFTALTQAAPNNPDMALAVGLLSMQLQDYDIAETHLNKAISLNHKEPDTVRFYLGQLNEERKRYDKAEEQYRSIAPGEQYFAAQIKVATMLAKQNRLQEGREHLRGVKSDDQQQKTQLILADANLLREAKAYEESFKILNDALEHDADSPDLLYDHAMAAEKISKLDVLEKDLRKLIEIKPDHAHAYNALGYTLADRTTRYAEAQELIKKALEYAPDDPFIVDSLGWVQYKMGNLDESVTTLQKAFDARPDPEIAAHLGEALWAKGKKNEASKIWQTARQEHPDNEALIDVMKKYQQ